MRSNFIISFTRTPLFSRIQSQTSARTQSYIPARTQSYTSFFNQSHMQPYRPFRVVKNDSVDDWVANLDLAALQEYGRGHTAINVLVLYGLLRERSFSRLLAFELARILDRLGAGVHVYDPTGPPFKDGVSENHPEVQELRELSQWPYAHFWVSLEQHGNITAVFKNQIDWIPLALGSIRPTQGGRSPSLKCVAARSASTLSIRSGS